MPDAIDYTTIRPAISKWVRETSGIQLVWRYRGGVRPTVPTTTYVELSLHGPRQVGSAWKKIDDAPDPAVNADLRVRARAHEMLRLELQVFADPKSGEDAERILANILRGLALYETDLDAAGIGIGVMEEIRYVNAGGGGLLEPRALASVWLHVGSEVEGRLGSIERAQVTATILDAAGEALDTVTGWMPTQESFNLDFNQDFEA